MATEQEGRKIQSVDRACDLLSNLRSHGPTTITELEEEMDLSAGTIHTYLSTLKDHGLVDQHGTEYQLGSMFIPYGIHVRNHSVLFDAAKYITKELAYDIGGCVHLMTEFDNRLLILEEVYGENTVGLDIHNKKRGRLQDHVHCTAGGKAILAYLPPEKAKRIIDEHGLPQRTSNTITDREELFEELKTVRDRGHALNDQEHMPGIRAVGAPICRDDTGEVLGTISISGSAASWTDDVFTEKLPPRVKEAATEVEISYHSMERDQ